MKAADFDYELPESLIAQEPLPERTASRMLVVRRLDGGFEHRKASELPRFVQPGDVWVVNDTRVVPYRLFGERNDTGGRVEMLLLREAGSPGDCSAWHAFYRAAGRPKPGMLLSLADGEIRAEIAEVREDGRVLVRLQSRAPIRTVLERKGFAPVPPYIKRPFRRAGASGGNDDGRAWAELDRARYQTVYARVPGSVAAPTAGLHFSRELIREMEKAGAVFAAITLHVGPGTFKPVKTELVSRHAMEAESFSAGAEAAAAINVARAAGRRVVCVGTTTVRALETIASDSGRVLACSGRTSLFIYPPFRFRITDAILTNFHLPRSTLIMMVSAFAGLELVKAAYREAVREKYRFYSYGDCMLIL